MALNVKRKLFTPVRAFRGLSRYSFRAVYGFSKVPIQFLYARARLSLSEKPFAGVTTKTAHSDPVSPIKILSVGPALTNLS